MSDHRVQLEEALRTNRVKVQFTKVNGEPRSMLCTKDTGLIPSDHLPKASDAKPNQALLKVYDLEKNGWRSMRFDNIQSWVLVD